MTEQEATKWVRSLGEDAEPEWSDVREAFVAVFGREPDDDDGDHADVFSHLCAAVGEG